MDLQSQVLSAINFSDVMSIVTTAGLALISLAFVSFVLLQAQGAANGELGDIDKRERDDDDER